MSWPLSQDYNEAIQSPASTFSDPDLKHGEAVANALGLPMPYSGNFADVYQVRGSDGSRWAVKCFTREAPGLRERYQEISKHLRQAKLPFTVDFSYLEQGIRVAGKWYPVLKMQWVEGLMLNQFVSQYLDKPATLEALLHLWGKMARYLRAAEVGHCDLQHGNVLLVPGSGSNSLALKLIDYDGMWVPALAGKKSGEVGHPCYQHPQRMHEGTYSIEVDRFPVLLVATSLRALKAKGVGLWARYDNGDNMLFKEADLREPAQSELLRDLLQVGDAAPLAAALAKSLWEGLAAAPLLAELTPETRPAPAPNAAPRPTSTPLPLAAARSAAPVARVIATAAPSGQSQWDFDEAPPTESGRSSGPLPRNSHHRTGVPIRALAALAVGLVVVMGAAAAGIYLATQSSPGKTQPGPAHAGVNGSSDRKSAKPNTDTRSGQAPPLESNFINSIGMKLVLIPVGRFLMGSPKDEEGRFAIEGPQHDVELTRPFYMGAYPVTKGQFGAFVKDAGYQTEAERDGKGGRGYNAATRKLEQDPMYNWKDRGFTQTDDHPVVNVTWNDATAFCAWLSMKEGKTYELPTEAEWEYACRAGTKTRFWCGDADASLKGNANVADASLKGKLDADYAKSQTFVSWDDGYPFTSPVGKLNPNPWGLYDMSGNVWQWCADRYGKYQYGSNKDPIGDENEEHRILRGGTWLNDPRLCRSANRSLQLPGTRFDDIGFRVVLRFAPRTAPAPNPQEAEPLGMKFVKVPAATFWMSNGGKNAQRLETIKEDFYMGVYAVTQEQWQSLMGNNPSHFSRGGADKDLVKDILDADLKGLPVENVSWNDAQEFLNRLNAKEQSNGWKYRLPTEAEWEYACRGEATAKADCDYDFYLDHPTNDLDSTQANFMGDHPGGKAAKGPYLGRPCKVGSYKPNRLGLYDMHGNVTQTCEAWSDNGGSGRSSPAVRGGSWHRYAETCRAAFRSESEPDERADDRGFRLARVPVGKEDK